MDPINLLKNLPFAIEGRIAEIANKRLGRHPSSAPFLSGDTFRSIADYVMDVDPVTPIPEVDKDGIFFLSSWRIEEFRAKVLSKIRHRIVLITHHGDIDVDEQFRDIAEHPSIIRWFAQNNVTAHPKIEPLPIGLEDQKLHAHGHVSDFRHLQKRRGPQTARVVWGFSLRTNPDRRYPCYRGLWHNPIADELWWPLNSRRYRKEICRYMFIASPPGNGFDCHRTWEALYLRIVPIVLDEYPIRNFIEKGLPLFPVKDWEQLRALNEDALRAFYEKNEEKFDSPLLSFSYWEKNIRSFVPDSREIR